MLLKEYTYTFVVRLTVRILLLSKVTGFEADPIVTCGVLGQRKNRATPDPITNTNREIRQHPLHLQWESDFGILVCLLERKIYQE